VHPLNSELEQNPGNEWGLVSNPHRVMIKIALKERFVIK
jgi:hypothetical protein